MNLVVGSGPSGVAAALALLERGQPVTMLDVGRELEPERAELPRRLAGLAYEDWPAADRERLASIDGPLVGGYPRKTTFGSDFAYREEPLLMPLDVREAEILISFARGGLSNIWGANLIAFGDSDLRGWPIDGAEIAPAYRAVLRHVPLSAARGDDFEPLLPLHRDDLEPRLLSAQAERMLADLQRHRSALHRRGVRFGPSRLSVWTQAAHDHAACVRCGFCLHGCPVDVIYCSSQTLAKLEKHPLFRYEPGLHVERFRESDRGVEVDAIRVGPQVGNATSDRAAAGAPVRFQGRRLFLGCGCYSTVRIVTQSLDLYGTEVTMRESQYFLIPMLHAHSFPHVAEERLQTLSQICLRLSDPAVCAHDVQMLIYTYSNLYRAALRRSAARFVPGVQRALLGRLLALQGYLHSDVSPRLLLSLRKGGAGPPVLEVRGRKNPEAMRVVRRIEARLWNLARLLGAAPIPFSTMVAPPGKSYHGGATFPMSREPRGHESDLFGRPMKLERVHVVDASVFPNIPATNLTLTVMANAYRIAQSSCDLEDAGANPGGR